MAQALAKAEFVQENAPERPDFKAKLFAEMDDATPPGFNPCLSSSSIAMDVTLLASDLMDDSRLVAPQGFEPRLIGSEPTVLPLNEGATD
jgi:carnitine 3-dehydrogenase